jgi:class 3 adenylate cyclase
MLRGRRSKPFTVADIRRRRSGASNTGWALTSATSVEESDRDLTDDGVNIAARLEGVAKPGAICLSEDAYRQVKHPRRATPRRCCAR